MKVRVTLKISDDARRCIATNMANAKVQLPYLATGEGMATRATCVRWLEECVSTAHAAYMPREPVNWTAAEETRLAVEQLRAAGWADSRIKAWLLTQAALMEGVKLKLWEAPLLVAQKDGEVTSPATTA